MKKSLTLTELQQKDYNDLAQSESALSELELQFKEKWHAVKDFAPGNDKLKMDTFEKWVSNVYKKQKTSLSRKIKTIKDRYGI